MDVSTTVLPIKTTADLVGFFKMDFQNSEILIGGRVKMVSLHHRAKFRGDRSNRC